jgi:hypothetical protein
MLPTVRSKYSIQELRNPNIVIYNIPEEVTIDNAEEII